MTSPINGTSGSSGTTPTSTTPTSTVPAGTSTSPIDASTKMDKDMFLKLLVAQLKYQDPSKPADATSFLAQTAQFTEVEKLTDLAAAQQQMLTAQLMAAATNLVGRTVVYTGSNGMPTTGVVTAATISGSNPTVKVGNKDVPLSSVTEVRTTNSTTS
jgi:flagellar basal-body rod modification protein FlgD